jgi:hypothetical protein
VALNADNEGWIAFSNLVMPEIRLLLLALWLLLALRSLGGLSRLLLLLRSLSDFLDELADDDGVDVDVEAAEEVEDEEPEVFRGGGGVAVVALGGGEVEEWVAEAAA